MEAEAVVFMAEVEEAFTAAVAAAPEGDLRPLRAMQVHALRPRAPAPVVGTQLGQAAIIPGPTLIRSMEARGREIRPLPVRLPPTANGIPLGTHLVAADLRQLNPEPGPRATLAASTSLAEIAERDLPARCEVFLGRATKFMRTLPPREM
jgi:hypothetical protein